MPIDIVGRMLKEQTVGLEVVALESTGVIPVYGCSHYQLIRQITGDDTVIEGDNRFGLFLTQIINIDRRSSFFGRRLDADVRVAEIGGDGRMDEVMLTAFAIDAVQGAVTDLRIGDNSIHMIEVEPVGGMIMDAATVHGEGGEGSIGAVTDAHQAHITREYIRIGESVGAW